MKLFKETMANQEVLLKKLAWLIIALGIILRIIVYLQNRDLFIDEANVARNIYERGFLDLLRPLDYEQYAPPIFLWILKISTLLFGYSEFAFRIYPLLAGIASVYVLFLILKELSSIRSLWYPLFLFATAFFFIRYSTELKQYISDLLITLLLIWCCLKTDVIDAPAKKILIRWGIVGSIAIWLSMSSVFILTGVGMSYLYTCLRYKNYKKILLTAMIGSIWVVQFLIYYLAILKPQANSDYLQHYHTNFFIIPFPNSSEQYTHNLDLFSYVLFDTGGNTFLAWVLNIILIVIGIVALTVKKTVYFLLFFIPFIAIYIASGMHQYAIASRLMLFMMPILLIFMACGFEVLLNIRFRPLKIIFVLAAIINAYNWNNISLVYKPYKLEELSKELDFLEKNAVHGTQLYVENGARPAFIYYTQIHPDKKHRTQYKDAHLLWWNANFEAIAGYAADRVAFIYTAISPGELKDHRAAIEKHLKLESFIEDERMRCYAYIYRK